MSGLRNKS